MASASGAVAKFIFARASQDDIIAALVGTNPHEKVIQVYEGSAPTTATVPYMVFSTELSNFGHRQDGSPTFRNANYMMKFIGHGNEYSWADAALERLQQLFTIKQAFQDDVIVGSHITGDFQYPTLEDGKWYSHVGLLVEIKSHARGV